jgi:hypothetical protein
MLQHGYNSGPSVHSGFTHNLGHLGTPHTHTTAHRPVGNVEGSHCKGWPIEVKLGEHGAKASSCGTQANRGSHQDGLQHATDRRVPWYGTPAPGRVHRRALSVSIRCSPEPGSRTPPSRRARPCDRTPAPPSRTFRQFTKMRRCGPFLGLQPPGSMGVVSTSSPHTQLEGPPRAVCVCAWAQAWTLKENGLTPGYSLYRVPRFGEGRMDPRLTPTCGPDVMCVRFGSSSQCPERRCRPRVACLPCGCISECLRAFTLC